MGGYDFLSEKLKSIDFDVFVVNEPSYNMIIFSTYSLLVVR